MQLKKGSHIHMMGICGTAMGGLAGLLKGMGYKVTGSDQNVYPPMSTQLESLGIKIKEGYKRENLEPKPDFVIVGNVMSRTHEEVKALLETDIPYTSLPDALGKFVIEDRKSIVVAGTHGKTTTTALMSWVAEQCGKNPGFLIGGKPQNFETSFKLPTGDYFVIEGDEYDTAFFAKVPKFLFYKPRYVILTSVEFDHADIYRDLDHVKEAFTGLLDIIPPEGILVSFADDVNIPSILPIRPSRSDSPPITASSMSSALAKSSTPLRFQFLESTMSQTPWPFTYSPKNSSGRLIKLKKHF
jgi:UDP-N-acetylmuramate: L-alanyl-gamma-D-glutamyl-meso-diaminopimelate ligase